MLIDLLSAKSAIVGVWFATLFIAERLARADRPPSSKARLFNNLGLWTLTLLLSIGLVAPLTAWGANHLLWERPDRATFGFLGALIIIVDMVILDCWTYWMHRAYHRIAVMWRLHEVHHRDQFLDTTSAVRFHFGEVALSACLRLIPIIIFAIPLSSVILFEIVLLCLTLFHHSNLRLPTQLEAALSRIIVTPSIHWVHHHATWDDTHSNYAACLSVWDRLFKTRVSAARLPGMAIGVPEEQDKPLIELIFLPLRRGRI